MSVDEVLRRGRADLKRNQDRLAEIARNEGVSVDQLVARLYENHPSAAELLPLVRRLTDYTREFVREKELVTIPELEDCHVRETPVWARDLWTAAMSPPGPFEKPVDGIYWITPVDPAWTPAQAEGWMRTLNHAMLKNTTVHEVWPGHYLQSLHFRKTSQTLARKVWFSYSFIEGWAHYCEQVALEVGFDGHSTSAEVTQLHDALLRDCRLIASIGMHTQGMPVAEAALAAPQRGAPRGGARPARSDSGHLQPRVPLLHVGKARDLGRADPPPRDEIPRVPQGVPRHVARIRYAADWLPRLVAGRGAGSS